MGKATHRMMGRLAVDDCKTDASAAGFNMLPSRRISRQVGSRCRWDHLSRVGDHELEVAGRPD
jgi:hypothetical protein